jgi:glycerol-3-phosphate dehydrogenase
LISVVGVKFTEARYVASKAVDLVFRKLGTPPPPSLTATTRVDGGRIEHLDRFLAQEAQRQSAELTPEVVSGLIYRYGSTYSAVLKYLANDTPFEPPPAGLPRLVEAEILHAVREEMAQKLTDVLFRRTTLGSFEALGEEYLRACAAVMAPELGWDETTLNKEVDEAQAATCR